MTKAPLVLTVPPATVTEAVVQQVAGELNVDAKRVSVLRMTRQRGGGVTAEVQIAQATKTK